MLSCGKGFRQVIVSWLFLNSKHSAIQKPSRKKGPFPGPPVGAGRRRDFIFFCYCSFCGILSLFRSTGCPRSPAACHGHSGGPRPFSEVSYQASSKIKNVFSVNNFFLQIVNQCLWNLSTYFLFLIINLSLALNRFWIPQAAATT